MSTVPDWLSPLLGHPLRREILEASDSGPCYLVGGAIRDLRIYGRIESEWDLIVTETDRTAPRLATALGGTAVRLGGDRFSLHRIVAGSIRLDLQTPLEPTLEAELLRRDLTVNAIALELVGGTMEDPAGGCGDLERRTLRQCSVTSFSDDPLRVLRLARFASSLPGFDIDPTTLEAARTEAVRLDTVARERIREELRKILGGRPRHRLGELLTSLRLHPALWTDDEPRELEVPPESANLDSASLDDASLDIASLDEALRQAEDASGWTAGPEDVEVLRHTALVLSACPPDQSPSADSLTARGFVSNAVGRRIDELLTPIPIPGDESARRLYLYRFGRSWPLATALHLWSARRFRDRTDEGARAWERTLRALVTTAERAGEELFDLRSPLDGDELQALFDLRPGRRLGRLIQDLREARVAGRIDSREEAVDWARRWIKTGGRPQGNDVPARDGEPTPGS